MPLVLSRVLAALLDPGAYPHPAAEVRLIETHVSWVLLAGEFAYKIKRPVHYPFVDLRELARRKFCCEEELRLNRRFAPALYLQVCRIIAPQGQARIGDGAPSEPIEYAVRMRRFPGSDELDHLLEGRQIEPSELEDFGRNLALIHARLPAATADAPWGRPPEIAAVVVRNLNEAAHAAATFDARAEVAALGERLRESLAAAEPAMVVRRADGRVRECHGDLHARNLVRIGRSLVAFDCMEFEPAFRWIDVADEIAFLLSDLAARERPLHAHAFRGGYLAQSGDYHACRVLELYRAHRALVRAKVAALSAAEAPEPEREALRAEHRRLMSCARESLSRKRPRIVLMCGLSGSGKTWLARPLAPRLNAVHLRSDIERKRRAGLAEHERSGAALASGIYSLDASASLYEHLVRCAHDILTGGYTVIVDATFLRRADRARFRELAQRTGSALQLIHCRAPQAALQTRVAARQHDASEADQQVLAWQLGLFEPVTAEEHIDVIPADTTDPNVFGRVLRSIEARELD